MSGTPGSENPAFRFMLITRSPELGAHAVRSGVDFVFVDLEERGKAMRQQGRDTVISRHTMTDVSALREVLPAGTLLVRMNPWDVGARREVDEVIARGADLIMLPMFRSPEEVDALVRAVSGRAGIVPLLETPEAAARAAEIAAVDGVCRVHIGLNDLHLGLRRKFMFELLTDGTVERITDAFRLRNVPFGIGGVARIGEGMLPAEYVLGEHVRLGSSAAILSRTFHGRALAVEEIERTMNLAEQVSELRRRLREHAAAGPAALERNRLEVRRRVQVIAGEAHG